MDDLKRTIEKEHRKQQEPYKHGFHISSISGLAAQLQTAQGGKHIRSRFETADVFISVVNPRK